MLLRNSHAAKSEIGSSGRKTKFNILYLCSFLREKTFSSTGLRVFSRSVVALIPVLLRGAEGRLGQSEAGSVIGSVESVSSLTVFKHLIDSFI